MKCLLFLLFALSANVVQGDEKLSVVSLSTVLTDIARNIGGDKVEIVSLVKPGMDPHQFEPTPSDIKAVSLAQIVLASGLGFETYFEKLRTAAGNGPRFIVVGDFIKPILVNEKDGIHNHHRSHTEHNTSGGTPDPHWWHSIANVKIAARVICNAFVAINSADKAIFEANTKAYIAQLDKLAKWARLEIAKLPKAKRILVTSHDALGYFARDYGFEIHPVQGISTTDQLSSKRVRDLIAEIQKKSIKAIFAENIENPKVLSEITKETGATLGGALYADGLGTKEANTYDSMMRHNVMTIVTALQ